VKYKFVSSDSHGNGETNLWLLNMRENYTLAYFTGGLSNPKLLAESAVIPNDEPFLPFQIHIAYGANNTIMKINWNSKEIGKQSLQYGTSPEDLSEAAFSIESETFGREEMCGLYAAAAGWHEPGFLHTATLRPLEPSTEYFFQVCTDVSKGSSACSDVHSFYTSAAVSPQTEIDFFIFGDMGQTETDGSNEHSQMDGSIFTTQAIADDVNEGKVMRNRSAAVYHIGGEATHSRNCRSLI
jgi:hypothetical protein